eukprot:EST47281.1 Hypothetical protein SS50377_12791 [Spironucleus salmonicida]
MPTLVLSMEILGVPYQWYPLQQQPAVPNMKVKPLFSMPTASTQPRSTKMWKAQASISSVLFLLNYGIATSLGPDHQLAPSRHRLKQTLESQRIPLFPNFPANLFLQACQVPTGRTILPIQHIRFAKFYPYIKYM